LGAEVEVAPGWGSIHSEMDIDAKVGCVLGTIDPVAWRAWTPAPPEFSWFTGSPLAYEQPTATRQQGCNPKETTSYALE